MEKANAHAVVSATALRGSAHVESARAHGFYEVECFDKDGNFKWRDRIENLVTTVGKNFALDTYLAGTAYTAAWFMGLIGATGFTSGPAAADTMASHPGWVEDTQYDETARPAAAWSAAAAGSKAMSSARIFTISATTTIKGCFLNSVTTKGGTTGTLYSAGLFSGGDKILADNDTLSVSYTAGL